MSNVLSGLNPSGVFHFLKKSAGFPMVREM